MSARWEMDLSPGTQIRPCKEISEGTDRISSCWQSWLIFVATIEDTIALDCQEINLAILPLYLLFWFVFALFDLLHGCLC